MNRVHQFWYNQDGWPAVAPLRYAGDPAAHPIEPAGAYRLLLHGRDINTFQHRSEPAQLNADGTVTGAYAGRWRLGAAGSLTVELEGTAYQGRFTAVYDAEQAAWVTALTALSPAGEALWGLRTAGINPSKENTP
ncbi:MAG: hypothetical protein LBU67_10600 [Oscillospiraceae bacterium]|nr:hypothetical protein [Oscillospiraceae bacterium]